MTTTDSFVHLHQHTSHSLLDGASKIPDAVAAAVADGQPAMAITDHGVMYGAIEFYKECKKQGIKPIIGSELYCALESVDERLDQKKKGGLKDADGSGMADKGRKAFYHMTTLAVSNTGYQNLMKLSSRAFLEGFYRKPRVDWNTLEGNVEGIVGTSGCLGGVVLQELLHDDYDAAVAAAARYQDIFGKENFFMELQDHGIPEQIQTNPQLIEIGKKIGAPLLICQDSHYVSQDDHEAHDSLLCLNTGSTIHTPGRFKFQGDQHYIKTAAEMRYLFSERPEACDNTLLVAERAELDIDFDSVHMPKFSVPDGYDDEEDYLRHLVLTGAMERWDMTQEVTDRLSYELDIICEMGFAGYFLITWDLVKHAKDAGIRVGPGRGSAGACAVAYSLDIVEIDPIRWKLPFERFLNPSRISMPDIDLDIDTRYRDHMINYCAHKYGQDHVAQIITFGKIGSRSAVRDAARVLDLPYSSGDKLAKALPPLKFGKDTPLLACMKPSEKFPEAYEQAANFRTLVAASEDSAEIYKVARGLEGLSRSDGIHAAAVVISPDPITEHVPIQQKKLKNGEPGPVVTQYEMNAVESLGLLKMDFLGLRTLDVITETIKTVKERHGVEINTRTIPLDNEDTYALLSSGETVGVFQLESSGMRELLTRLRPDKFEDVAACIALYRPGPLEENMHNDYADRKNGLQAVESFHPDANDILSDTYFLMIYQESVMEIAQKFAGYSMAEADTLRKAMGKKIAEVMEAEREKFVSGCNERGYEDISEPLFETISNFAAYAFNKSHSYGYGLVTYHAAYLKYHYPVEYMSALLTSVQNDQSKLAVYLAETKRMGIEVLAPDINLSGRNFVPLSDTKLIYGFQGIKHVGEAPSRDIINLRDSDGPYNDFFDYVKRNHGAALNKKALLSLISAGSFDSVGHPRRGLANIYEEVVKGESLVKKQEGKGQFTLFDTSAVRRSVSVPELFYSKEELLALEKQYLGVYVTGHPLDDIQDELTPLVDYPIHELDEIKESLYDKKITVAGSITLMKNITTKKGDAMKVFSVEDMTGSLPCVLFPRQHKEFGKYAEEDNIIIVYGKIEEDRAGPKMLIETIKLFKTPELHGRTVHIKWPEEESIDELLKFIKSSNGFERVVVHHGGSTKILPQEFTCNRTDALDYMTRMSLV
jgi:DNA polymerase-3 subunit alpha